MYMRKALVKMGFENFDEAKSGLEALEMFSRQSYDVILMDVQMPEMDGFEASRRIRETEDAESAPVIIAVTADAMKGAEEQCMKAGMDDYISKPIERQKLFDVLRQWIPGDESAVIDEVERGRDADAVLINFAHIDDFSEGDLQIERELYEIFLKNMAHDFDQLQRALTEKDYEGWDRWVHKIYGACAHIGAEALAEVCDIGQNLYPEKTSEIPRYHEKISKCCDETIAAIHERLAELQPKKSNSM